MIRQAHYTSVAQGPSGTSGFQFCARSDDLDDTILRSVERLTTYHRPPDVSIDADLSEFPVNLIYAQLDAAELKLLARVQYTGEDFSQRAGNYFVHSLIVDAVPGDLGSPFPAELWDAPFWQSAPGSSEHLPLLPSLPAEAGVRPALHSALQQAHAYDRRLAWLTAAADAAIDGGSHVLLVGPTDEIVWQWIMAASYLLGPHIAPRLSFCTYGHDPARAGTHLVGLVSSRRVTPARSAGFAVLDLGANDAEQPAAPVNEKAMACAAMLTRAGVVAAEPAWHAAAAIARPTSGQLAGWYPVLACALVSLGTQLAPADIAVAIEWLADAKIDRARHIAVLQGFARQPLGELGTRHQARLIEAALGLDGGFSAGKSETAASIEQALVDQTLARLAHKSGEPAIVRLRTRAGVQKAAAECDRALSARSGARQRLAVLRWAAQAGAEADDALVAALGSEIMGLALIEDGWAADLIGGVARDWPAFRAGMVTRLTTEPDAVVEGASAYFTADIFEPSDFAAAPRLGDRWVATRAAARHASPVEELIEICELRRITQEPGLTDSDLLWRLWPSGAWTAAEAMAIANAFAFSEVMQSTAPAAMAATFLRGPGSDAERRHWTDLAVYIARWPEETQSTHGVGAARTVKVLRDVIAAITSGPPETPRMSLITRLVSSYPSVPPVVQAYLAAEIPQLILLHHPRPYLVLATCPQPVLTTFCELSRENLLANPHNAQLAARLFLTLYLMRTHKDKNAAGVLEASVLSPLVNIWNRRDLAAIGRELNAMQPQGGDYTQKLSDVFNRWVKEQKRIKEQAKKANF